MILEAQQIYESLVDSGWNPTLTHGDLFRPGKAADAIRVELSCDGKKVSSIHIVDKETVSKYWAIGDNNKNRFPVLNLELPESCKNIKSHEALKEWATKSSKDKKHQLEKWLQNDFPVDKLGELSPAFQKRLNERCIQLESIAETSAASFLTLLKLFAECSSKQYQKWLIEILEMLKSMSLDENECSDVAQRMLVSLIFTARPEKGSRDKNKAAIPVIWDVARKGLNEYQAASPLHYEKINSALLKSDCSETTALQKQRCAITDRTDLENKTFPQPNLPQLGPSRLYSRNDAIKSFGRYGKFGSDAFPLSHSHGTKLAGAISTLTTLEKEGKTWTKVIGEKWKKGQKKSIPTNDLLIVYQASLIDHEFATALGTDQRVVGEANFDEICKRLIERTRGAATNQLRGKLFIVVIRKVDDGNRKVIFHNALNVESLENSARLWQDACKALPCLKLHIPREKGKAAIYMAPPVLSPGSLPALTKTFHFLDGRTSDSPGGITFPDAMRLLLTIQSPDSKLVKRCLSTAIRRLGPLLQRTAAIKYRSPSDLFKINGDQKWNILKTQSLLSVLITSSNRKLNTVMNSIAYQLGQLCSVFDLIHSGYCHQKRDGDLPPKLIGNVCFQAANRNPLAALSQLSQRAAPYLAWLTEIQNIEISKDKPTEEEWAVIHARSAAKDIKNNSEKIHRALLTKEAPVDDLFRAELLLGYLAGFPKKEQQ